MQNSDCPVHLRHSAKISCARSCLLKGKSKFSKDTVAPFDVRLVPQNLLLSYCGCLIYLGLSTSSLEGVVGLFLTFHVRIFSSAEGYEKFFSSLYDEFPHNQSYQQSNYANKVGRSAFIAGALSPSSLSFFLISQTSLCTCYAGYTLPCIH